MDEPVSYLDLVISVVRGRSPIPEHQDLKRNWKLQATQHIEKLKSTKLKTTKEKLILKTIHGMGPNFLEKIWTKLSPHALTMCGDKSIEQLRSALETVHREKIPGDFIETGVWRGGLPIIMRAFLHQVQDTERKVYLADSFRGLPLDGEDPNDRIASLLLEPLNQLGTSRRQVEESFEYFGLLDDQTVFLEGWFEDTLPKLREQSFAIVRLDGDYYESTRDAIENLYPRLSRGGFLIIDDYNLPLGCKKAIDEYRQRHKILDDIISINKQAIYWRKF